MSAEWAAWQRMMAALLLVTILLAARNEQAPQLLSRQHRERPACACATVLCPTTNVAPKLGAAGCFGAGGQSIYGEPFKDEFHSRLRFNHRWGEHTEHSRRPFARRSTAQHSAPVDPEQAYRRLDGGQLGRQSRAPWAARQRVQPTNAE